MGLPEENINSNIVPCQLETKTLPSRPSRSGVVFNSMEYNTSVEKFRDEEYPNMSQGM